MSFDTFSMRSTGTHYSYKAQSPSDLCFAGKPLPTCRLQHRPLEELRSVARLNRCDGSYPTSRESQNQIFTLVLKENRVLNHAELTKVLVLCTTAFSFVT